MFSPYEHIKTELQDVLVQLEQFFMVTHLDRHGAIIYTNEAFLTVSQWTPKRVLGKTFWQMFPDNDEGQRKASDIWTQLLNGKPWSGAVKKLSRTGATYHVKMTAIPIVESNDKLKSVLTFETDMTADVKTQKQLEQIAFIDFESGLMNRHSLETTTNQFITNQDNFAFVYLSIDRFYALDDFHSNESRKEIIEAFADRMKRYFQNGQITRIGVNEFVILTQLADWFIEGFNDFLKQHPIHVQESTLTLTTSGGIIRYPEHQLTYPNLMKAATTAAQHATGLGGESILTLSADSHKALNRKSLISQKLPLAIAEKQLQVVYQPQLDCKKNEVILYEALIRWEDEELGVISPDELIPIAEESGFIRDIGTFVLTNAAQLAATLNRHQKPTVISVNASVREFISHTRNKQIMNILSKASCPPNLIQLEITETFAFKAEVENSVFHQMNALHEEGIEFALDDFGTGYASFRYLQSLPVTKVKIDKEFIHAITTHEKTKKLVNGMIQFAKSMDMFVIAEGVETEEQRSYLEELNIDALQGYLIGAPITEEKVLATI